MVEVLFQEKILTTPQGNPFDVPTLALAKAMVEEWEKDPLPHYGQKPLTSLAATAIDQVTSQRKNYVAYCLQVISQDSLLFWEEKPDSLVALQKEKWQPCLDQVNTLLKLNLKPTFSLSLTLFSTEEESLIKNFLKQQDNFMLAGFLNLLALTQSFSLSFLILKGHLSQDEAWELAHLHEHLQQETWGKDNEAQKREKETHQDFLTTVHFLALLDTIS